MPTNPYYRQPKEGDPNAAGLHNKCFAFAPFNAMRRAGILPDYFQTHPTSDENENVLRFIRDNFNATAGGGGNRAIFREFEKYPDLKGKIKVLQMTQPSAATIMQDFNHNTGVFIGITYLEKNQNHWIYLDQISPFGEHADKVKLEMIDQQNVHVSFCLTVGRTDKIEDKTLECHNANSPDLPVRTDVSYKVNYVCYIRNA